MATTPGKARRASTPLSSPPPSPSSTPTPPTHSYAFDSSGESYYSDDQSDSCFASDDGHSLNSDFDSGSDIDIDTDSDASHEEYCDLHTSSLATHCNGFTYSGKRCSRKAHVFADGRLPVCRSHAWLHMSTSPTAGKCQAISACGHLCNRITLFSPPSHFCEDHMEGTDYITRLPTEIRLMIFRYLIPNVISPERSRPHQDDYVHTAVLFVSRQFHDEAALLIYGEPKFEARIWPTFVEIYGRRWDREATCYIFKEPTKALCGPAACRIRHLDVRIMFASSRSNIKGLTRPGRLYEEYELYQLRDTIRKFIEVLSPSSSNQAALKRLSVTPAPSCSQLWQSDEATAAIFFVLEPFLSLRPIGRVALQPPPCPSSYLWRERNFPSIIANLSQDDHYCTCRNQWISLMTFGIEPPKSIEEASKMAALEIAYRKIEDFVRLIYKQDAHGTLSVVKYAWTSSIFEGIERVLHIARVAFDDNDLDCLTKIHEAILERWVRAHRHQIQSLSAIARSVSAMFDCDPASRYPEAFDLPGVDPVEAKLALEDYMWPEIPIKSPMPKLKGPGVIVKEKRQKVYVEQNGEQRVWAKTPAVVRQLRAYKQSNP